MNNLFIFLNLSSSCGYMEGDVCSFIELSLLCRSDWFHSVDVEKWKSPDEHFFYASF